MHSVGSELCAIPNRQPLAGRRQQQYVSTFSFRLLFFCVYYYSGHCSCVYPAVTHCESPTTCGAGTLPGSFPSPTRSRPCSKHSCSRVASKAACSAELFSMRS